MFLFTDRYVPRTHYWPEVPAIAYQAEDFKGSEPSILENSIHPHCNRAAWKYQPSPSLENFVAAVKADESHEDYYRELFAEHKTDIGMAWYLSVDQIHNYETHKVELDDGQKITTSLSRELLAHDYKILLDHIKTVGNSLVAAFDGKFKFVSFDCRYVSIAEAEAKRLRSRQMPGFHIDGDVGITSETLQQVAVIDNILGPQTRSITARAYSTVLEYTRGRVFHGPIDPVFEIIYESTIRKLRNKSGEKINFAAWAAINANRKSGNDDRVVCEGYEHYQVNIFSRGDKKEWLLASPELQKRVLHIHAEPERQAAKRLTLIADGNVLTSRL